jgi:hypothetical protein
VPTQPSGSTPTSQGTPQGSRQFFSSA